MFHSLRGRVGAALFVVLLLGASYTLVHFANRSQSNLQHLREATFIKMRIEEVPILRSGSPPVEVMVGVAAHLSCERITPRHPAGELRFRFTLGTTVREAADCTLEHTFEGEPGTTVPVVIEYLLVPPDASPRVMDRFEGAVTLKAPGPYVQLRALETPDGKPLPTVTVPQYVVPFVDAALDLPDDASPYVALFFLRRPDEPTLHLRIGLPDETGRPLRAIAAKLQRYRRHGPELAAFAGWPKEPIAIGEAEDLRELFELQTAVFKVEDVPTLLERCCSAAEPGGLVAVRGLRPEEVEPLAVEGRFSRKVRVVRAAHPGSGGVVPKFPGEPAAAAPAEPPPEAP